MEPNWQAIADAVKLIRTGAVKRIDGDGWKAYQAGTIIRVDLEASPAST